MSGNVAEARPRVLYVGGCGRSGSTLVDLILGELPGFFSVGELRFIWQRGLVENQLCGCGMPFRDCFFWSEVGARGFGGWGSIDGEEMAALERSVDRHRYLPFLLGPRLWADYDARVERYTAVTTRLYRTIRSVSGCEVIIDSTKDPPYAFLLRSAGEIDLRVIHLVRDSRGVAFSWTKVVRKPEAINEVAHMSRFRPVSMGARWMVYNSLFHVLERLGVPRTLLRYEEFVTFPRAELKRVLGDLGHSIDDRDLGFIRDGHVHLGIHHTVAGNPMRFKHGAVPLRIDDAWRTRLPPGQRAVVSLITRPLLRQYGYSKDSGGAR